MLWYDHGADIGPVKGFYYERAEMMASVSAADRLVTWKEAEEVQLGWIAVGWSWLYQEGSLCWKCGI